MRDDGFRGRDDELRGRDDGFRGRDDGLEAPRGEWPGAGAAGVGRALGWWWSLRSVWRRLGCGWRGGWVGFGGGKLA